MSHCVSRGALWAGAAEGKCGDRAILPSPTLVQAPCHSRGGPSHKWPLPQPCTAQGTPGLSQSWDLGTPQPCHFLFHLMGMRPDSRAVLLAIFRVRLCNFVEGMTKGHVCSFQGGQREVYKTAFGRRLRNQEATPESELGSKVRSPQGCRENPHFSAFFRLR